MIGHSSGRVMWWMPNTYHSTMSVSLQRLVVGDPVGDAVVVAGALRRVHAGRPALVVVVLGDPQLVAEHRRPLELRGLRIHHDREAGPRDQFVAHRVPQAVVLAGVDHLPAALGVPVEVAAGFALPGDRRGLGGQRQAVGVVGAGGHDHGVHLEGGVVAAIHVQVQACHQEVLVVGGVGALVHDRAVRRAGLPLRQRRGDHDAGGAHLALDVAVLVEPPVDEVLVVGHGRVHGDHEPAHPPHLGPVVGVDVLPQHEVVLLVHADRVGDLVRLAGGVRQYCVEVADLAEAVAAELQRGGHVPQAPFTDVVGGAPVVIGRGVAVGDDHLRERQPIGHGAPAVGQLVDDRTLRGS